MLRSSRRALALQLEVTMPFSLRPLVAADAPRIAELINRDSPEPASVDEVRERIVGQAQPGRVILRLGAEDATGALAGYGHAIRDAYMAPGLFWAHVVVDPTARRQGAGSQIHAAVRSFAREHGATRLRGEIRDHLPEGMAFAQAMGYAVERHIFESTLRVAAFDERPFLAALEAASAQGISFFSLAEVGDTRAARERLWELERTVTLDIPGGSEASIRPFVVWERQVIESGHYLAEGQLVAAHEDDWVGLAALLDYPESGTMYHGVTGVLPAYRGKGLATALKLLAIRLARARGVRILRTNNDAENAQMLAVNRKLGYQPEPGYYRLVAYLDAGD
jgi:GNAT superfamily N-acetyltransferase